MPSELQRVARGLVDCFDEIPRVVDQLLRTAARCRENAQVALIASRGQATVAAQQLDAAARACEAAAHYLSMAPPKARGWAEGLVGAAGPSTNRPSSDSANRNKATSGVRKFEAPLVTVARKAFEKYRPTQTDPLELEITVTESGDLILEERNKKEEAKREERLTADFEFAPDRDEEDEPPEYEERDEKEEAKREERLTADFEFAPNRDDADEPPEYEEPDKKEEAKREERLTADFEFAPDRDEEDEPPEYEERDEKEEAKREERLTGDHEIDVDLTEAVKLLLASMAESEGQEWQHATLTITTEKVEATFVYPEEPRSAPISVDIELPALEPVRVEFDPAFDVRPLELEFSPGVHDPRRTFDPCEMAIAQRLAEDGWRVDARLADHETPGKKNPDVMVRKSGSSRGVIVEFKTPESRSNNALKRNMNAGSRQAGSDGEVVIDGRPIDLSDEDAQRAFRRACGQPGSRVARLVHVILGDGRMVTFVKET
ncbi:hypothetical protein ACQHIV_03510 [Kribbella sp. GL6]|uniref:hypothetical protein n=1 Tax=Kribbella sp. GL6 TaxID=3419765 RepID=UPI003D02A353